MSPHNIYKPHSTISHAIFLVTTGYACKIPRTILPPEHQKAILSHFTIFSGLEHTVTIYYIFKLIIQLNQLPLTEIIANSIKCIL